MIYRKTLSITQNILIHELFFSWCGQTWQAVRSDSSGRNRRIPHIKTICLSSSAEDENSEEDFYFIISWVNFLNPGWLKRGHMTLKIKLYSEHLVQMNIVFRSALVFP